MGDVRLSLPKIRVLRDGQDPLELQVLNPDLLRWDTTRARHKWPGMKEGPHLWMTFLAWAAATRTGATSERWESFRDTVLEVTTVDADDQAAGDDLAPDWTDDADDDDGEPGVPTPPGPGPG